MKQQHTLIVLLLQTTISFLGTQVVAQTPEPNNALGELRRIEAAIMKNLRRVEQATVCLQAGGGSGSAVIVSKDGLILTAAHVVEGHQTMTVRFADDRTVQCKVLGTYGPADAAMAQIIDKGEYVFAEIAAEGSVKQGDTIYALGNPSGFDPERGMPIRLGHIVTTEKNFFSCDASLIRGDSGGPSFNLDGEVVGIHSNISESVSVNNDAHIDAFHRHWQSMLAGEKKGRTLEPENAPDELVVGLKLLGNEPGEPIRIEQVIAETPAAWALLETGDEIVRVNEITVTNSADFLRKAKQNEWGRTLQLEVLRAGEKLQLRLELMTYAEVQAKRASSKQATPESPPKASAEPGDDKTEVFYKVPQQQTSDGAQGSGKKSFTRCCRNRRARGSSNRSTMVIKSTEKSQSCSA